MERVADGVWVADAPFSFFGVRLGTRMTVVRLRDGGLFVHSPVSLTPALRAEVDALGSVRHIVAPNIAHHLYVGEWKEAYPDALLHAALGLAKRRKDLAIDHELRGQVHDAWRADLDATFIEGSMVNETVFLHRPSRTLVVSDAIQNFDSSPDLPTRLYFKLMGMHGKRSVSRLIRPFHRDRKAVRRSLDEILRWDFDRLVPCHGDIIETGGKDALVEAYTWLD
jgi:hypothetical protein